MELKIRTGNQIRARLATTVTFENVFTELVKNSLQNNAKNVYINYNNSRVVVLDDGGGFDHLKDETGLNEFDKYFVYGNSYSKKDKTLNLGEMGVGGKAANDKLSNIKDTHWSIYTTNKHGKSFQMDFKSSNENYLDEVKPTLKEIKKTQTGINTSTGTRIVIHKLNTQLLDSGWPDKEIQKNLQLFFNMLFFQTEKQNRAFKLFVNGKEIKFNKSLPGDKWLEGKRIFICKINGKNTRLEYKYKLNHLTKEASQEKSLLQYVDLVSYTRVRELRLNPSLIDSSEYEFFNSTDVCEYWNRQIRGYITCPGLSDVKDENGMSAKDLTHHRLNPNHPVTKAFYNDFHKFISKPLCSKINDFTNPDKFAEKTLHHVSKIIYSGFNIQDEFIVDKE